MPLTSRPTPAAVPDRASFYFALRRTVLICGRTAGSPADNKGGARQLVRCALPVRLDDYSARRQAQRDGSENDGEARIRYPGQGSALRQGTACAIMNDFRDEPAAVVSRGSTAWENTSVRRGASFALFAGAVEPVLAGLSFRCSTWATHPQPNTSFKALPRTERSFGRVIGRSGCVV